MRLAINLVLSLGMLALCTWLVWPDAGERIQLHAVIGGMRWADFAPYLAGYLGLQLAVHLCRSVRWNHLLAPLGVRVPLGPLLAISSVGFMAILAFPARLGEFVRPGLLRKSGYTTAAAALGTVAVERIVDGLIISLLVFGAFFAHRGPRSPGWMMPTAYLALGVFAAALVFLVFAMWRPNQTVRIGLSLTLLPRFAPRLAAIIEHRLLDMIRGFAALKHARSLAGFLVWSFAYWAINGFAMWLLAHAFHLDLSLIGAYATMGLLGVGISLPNSPGLVGQFQAFTLLGLSLYLDLGSAAARTPLYAVALTYAIAQHLLQVAWYVAMGAIGLATPWVSFHDLWSARKVTSDEAEPAAPGVDAAAAQVRAPIAPGGAALAGPIDDQKLAPGPRGPDDPAHAHDSQRPAQRPPQRPS
ncbi:MAG TPA: lysylphosphatidylglycerol synthase transmembrane domain-containing protein [Kofleriaceae bacterium]|nr:lysylphosphatidylglycerol synthase transmembrane domain-containing protein [Kofleriaceae bacterium]